VASNLQKRLDKIEKGLAQVLENQNPSGPIYLNEGDPIPEGREAIVIAMLWVEPSYREDEPEVADRLDGERLGEISAPRKTTSTHPPIIETHAEREKRWAAHLRAIDARGDRYTGEEGTRDIRRENWRRGIV